MNEQEFKEKLKTGNLKQTTNYIKCINPKCSQIRQTYDSIRPSHTYFRKLGMEDQDGHPIQLIEKDAFGNLTTKDGISRKVYCTRKCAGQHMLDNVENPEDVEGHLNICDADGCTTILPFWEFEDRDYKPEECFKKAKEIDGIYPVDHISPWYCSEECAVTHEL